MCFFLFQFFNRLLATPLAVSSTLRERYTSYNAPSDLRGDSAACSSILTIQDDIELCIQVLMMMK